MKSYLILYSGSLGVDEIVGVQIKRICGHGGIGRRIRLRIL